MISEGYFVSYELNSQAVLGRSQKHFYTKFIIIYNITVLVLIIFNYIERVRPNFVCLNKLISDVFPHLRTTTNLLS